MFTRNMCYCFIKSVMQDYFKTHLDACTSIDYKKNWYCCIHKLKCNKMAKFYKSRCSNNKVCINTTDYAARSLNCLLRVIWFWSDNAEGSAQCRRLDNPEGRLTECRIIEVLLYYSNDGVDSFKSYWLTLVPRKMADHQDVKIYWTRTKIGTRR